MRYCCILGCSSTSNDGVKLHEFPFDNQSLLRVWIMVTNRTEWLPVIQSRICDKHFSIDDYEGGDKNNKLKPNACPMFNTPNNNVEDSITITDSSDSSCYEMSSTSDVNNVSDIDSEKFPNTPNTSDMKQSDTSDDSTISSLFDSNLDEATGLDDEFLSSLSEHGFNVENIDVDQPSQEFDTISLSSSSTNFETTDQIINERCAVVFCNKKVRENFDGLFFIDFPKNKSIRNIWWTLCGRQGKFDPSFKVCSIHFDVQDFIIIRREGIHYQAILKTNNIVPTVYLLPHEYNTFKKKQKPNNKNRKRTSNNLTEIIKCTVKGCKKTFLNDGKRTLFFKFPLKNKCLLKDWVNSIGLPNWQPSESDRLCSDHFENYFIVKIKDAYELNKYAIPSIKPKNPFFINSGDLKNKTKNSVFNHSYDSSFNCLEFNKLNSNTLVVKDRKRRKVEDKKSDMLDPLQNNIETYQPKAKENAPAETTIQMKTKDKSVVQENKNPPTKCNKTNHEYVGIDNLDNVENLKELQVKGTASLTKQYLESFEREIAKEKEVVNQNSFNPIDLEYIYLDVLDGQKVVEEQPLNNANNSLKNDRSKPGLVSTSNLNNLKNRIEVDPKVNTNSVSPKPWCTSKGTKKSKVESTDNIVLKGTNLIPVSKNNGNEKDYVYLDMLNGDEFKNLLSFEKKTTPKYAKKKIPELIEKIQPKGIPESILNNPDLTECYGEILPPWCSPDCQLKCYYSIPGPQRTEIYKEFQKLTSITEQNCKIVELVKLRTIKKVDSTFESIPSYCFMMNKATVNVCQTFFMNTLGITEQRLNAVLVPVNYSWFSNKDAVLRANLQKSAKVINKSSNTTDFVKESLKLLEKDYNLHEPESDTEVSLDNVPADEYEKVFVFMKGIPRVLSSYQKPGDTEKQFFETTICFEYMYKTYSENYIKNKTPPPYSKRQFKKIYNQYMKTFLKMV